MAQDLVLSEQTTASIDPVLLGSCMDIFDRWLKKYRRETDNRTKAQIIALLYEQVREDQKESKPIEHTLDWLSRLLSAPKHTR